MSEEPQAALSAVELLARYRRESLFEDNRRVAAILTLPEVEQRELLAYAFLHLGRGMEMIFDWMEQGGLIRREALPDREGS